MTALTRGITNTNNGPRRLMRFADGLIIDPTQCPLGVIAHNHWRRIDGLDTAGAPNAECACPKPGQVA